jgi:hypothetical protein
MDAARDLLAAQSGDAHVPDAEADAETDAAEPHDAETHVAQADEEEADAFASRPDSFEAGFAADEVDAPQEEPAASEESWPEGGEGFDDIAFEDESDDERTGDEADELFDLNAFGLSFGGQSAPASRPPSSDSLGLTLRPDGSSGTAEPPPRKDGEDDDDSNDDPEDLFSSMFGDQR